MILGRRGAAGILLATVFLGASGAAAQDPRLPHPRPALPSEATVSTPVEEMQAGDSTAAAESTADDIAAGTEVPLPRPRPTRNEEVVAPVLAEDPTEGEGGPMREAAGPPAGPTDARTVLENFAREPRPRPDPPATLALIAPPEIVIPDPAPGMSPPDDSAASYASCLSRLRQLGVAFTEEARIDPPGGCGVQRPLNVRTVGSGISVTPEAILNCATTEALAVWARNVLVPAAAEELDAVPNHIVHGSAYVCRPRNNQAGARLSEHATGNAFDIGTVGFADREPMNIGKYASRAERRFEDTIRAGSCAYFTTVLGPRSNAAHAVHLHFDLAQRRGGYRLCDMGGARTAGRSR